MRICVFEMFNTLDDDHVQLSLKSLLVNQSMYMKWDRFVVYNTHSTYPTEKIVELVKHYGLGREGKIEVLERKDCRNLHQDFINVFGYVNETSGWDPYTMLYLKSDYCISSNFNVVYSWLDALPDKNWQWNLAGYTSKEWLLDTPEGQQDILRRAEEGVYIPRNEYISFDGGNNPAFPLREKMASTLGKGNTDPSVKFIAHTVVTDLNVHVVGSQAAQTMGGIFPHVLSPEGRYFGGGPLFDAMARSGIRPVLITDAYQLHMFHAVDRFYDPMKMTPGQRY